MTGGPAQDHVAARQPGPEVTQRAAQQIVPLASGHHRSAVHHPQAVRDDVQAASGRLTCPDGRRKLGAGNRLLARGTDGVSDASAALARAAAPPPPPPHTAAVHTPQTPARQRQVP